MFKTTIGLEIHVQLKTKSKMFCGCDNKADEAAPNTLVCPVCLGLPGVLPVANRQAIELTLKAGLALNCQISKISHFDRKHYFYPDLPKGYQISQFDHPFCTGGFLEIENKNEIKKINITRIHLEEDAGKLLHTKDVTLVDLNRAGTPLLEIVTEPEISSAWEAKIFMQELRLILRYLDVSDADMEKGHLRCDANISVTINPNELGTPVEIKNLNSFKMVERALSFEENRQKDLIERGEKIVKETRGWNDSSGKTYLQRSKEFAQDYRYFPEPDIPPFENYKLFKVEKLKEEMPELPDKKRKRYINMGLSKEYAFLLSEDTKKDKIFNKLSHSVSDQYYRLLANAIINNYFDFEFSDDDFAKNSEYGKAVMAIYDKGLSKINFSKIVDLIHKESFTFEKAIKELGLDVENKSGKIELAKIIDEVLSQNKKTVSDYQLGKKEALGFLIGQVMRQTRGLADPQIINKILIEKIK